MTQTTSVKGVVSEPGLTHPSQPCPARAFQLQQGHNTGTACPSAGRTQGPAAHPVAQCPHPNTAAPSLQRLGNPQSTSLRGVALPKAIAARVNTLPTPSLIQHFPGPKDVLGMVQHSVSTADLAPSSQKLLIVPVCS